MAAPRRDRNRDREFRNDPSDSRIEQLRMPPHSIEAEQAVLGGLMLVTDAYDRVNDKLTPNDFYRRDHQLIYRAISELAERNRPYDAVTLGEWFEGQGQSDLIADGAYLIELASSTPSAANIAAYAEIDGIAGVHLMAPLGVDAVPLAIEQSGVRR